MFVQLGCLRFVVWGLGFGSVELMMFVIWGLGFRF